MDIETLAQQIAEMQDTMQKLVTDSVNTAINGYDARLKREVFPKLEAAYKQQDFQTADTESVNSNQINPNEKVLEGRLAELEARLQAKETSERQARLDNRLLQRAPQDLTVSASEFIEYFKFKLQGKDAEIIEQDNQTFVKLGEDYKSLDEYFTAFTDSEGAVLRKPTVTSGVKTSGGVDADKSEVEASELSAIRKELGI